MNKNGRGVNKLHDHLFILPSPNGPTCVGVCACGEQRVMPNSLPHGKYNGHRNRNVGHYALIAKSRRDTVEREDLATAVIGAGARDTT